MDLKTTDPLCFHFITVFFFRRAVYASLFVLFGYYPMFQVIMAMGCAVFMFLYLVIVRPYVSFLSTFLSILNEILLGVMIVTTFRFVNPEISPSMSSQLGSFLVGILATTIAVNWVAIVIFGIVKMVHKRSLNKKLKKLRSTQEKIDKVSWTKGDIDKISH